MDEKKNQFENEINVFDLWKMIAKRKTIIIGAFLLCIIAAIIMTFLVPKIYQGDAMLMLHPASGLSVKELADFIGTSDGGKIESMLPKTHSSITDIKFNVSKDAKESTKLLVIFEATDRNSIQPAFLEFIEYIDNVDFIKTNIKEEQERIAKRSAEHDIIIAASSELLNDYRRLLQNGKLISLGFNPVDLNRSISDIKVEKLKIEQSKLRIKGGVEIARKLYVGKNHIKPSKRKIVLIGGMAGLFIGITLAFIMGYAEKIKSRPS